MSWLLSEMLECRLLTLLVVTHGPVTGFTPSTSIRGAWSFTEGKKWTRLLMHFNVIDRLFFVNAPEQSRLTFFLNSLLFNIWFSGVSPAYTVHYMLKMLMFFSVKTLRIFEDYGDRFSSEQSRFVLISLTFHSKSYLKSIRYSKLLFLTSRLPTRF